MKPNWRRRRSPSPGVKDKGADIYIFGKGPGMSSSRESAADVVIVKCTVCDRAYKVHIDRLPRGVTSFPCRACGTLLPVRPPVDNDRGFSPAGDEAPTVLIASNEKDLAALIRRILQGNGYRVFEAASGQETLRTVRENPVDLLLVNIFLPDMMGFEVLDRIREERDGSVIPSILLSSVHHAARYKRAPTSLYGADDYIERHHLPDLLVPKISRLLEKSGQDRQPLAPSRMPALDDEQVLQRRELEEIENRSEKTWGDREADMRRLCRVVAGDIALYNQDLIRSTEPALILAAISEDIKEGEALLGRKFPGQGQLAAEFLREEIELLLKSRGILIP
jgi:DNA-binding response OmpR family regulator